MYALATIRSNIPTVILANSPIHGQSFFTMRYFCEAKKKRTFYLTTTIKLDHYANSIESL